MVFAINDIETCDSKLFETGALTKNNAIEIETNERRVCFYDLADCM